MATGTPAGGAEYWSSTGIWGPEAQPENNAIATQQAEIKILLNIVLFRRLEHLKKLCSRAERGFLGFGDGADHRPSVKAQVWKTLLLPIIGLSRNEAKTQKDRFYIFLTAWLKNFFKCSKDAKLSHHRYKIKARAGQFLPSSQPGLPLPE